MPRLDHRAALTNAPAALEVHNIGQSMRATESLGIASLLDPGREEPLCDK